MVANKAYSAKWKSKLENPGKRVLFYFSPPLFFNVWRKLPALLRCATRAKGGIFTFCDAFSISRILLLLILFLLLPFLFLLLLPLHL